MPDERVRLAGVSAAGEHHAQLGYPRLHLRRTDSTNARARALALAGAPHGTLVSATEQTAGRGRQGRSWSAPAGSSLLMSLLLRERPLALLPLLAAVAVCDVVGPRARIKWPNDIVLERPPGGGEASPLAKVAGILAEGRPQQRWAVLGVGLNVALGIEELPVELRASAASLGLEPNAIEPLLAELLVALARRMRETPAQTLQAWSARDALRGRPIAWSAGHGRAAGIDGEGRLRVELPRGGYTTLTSAEVHLTQIG